MPLLSTVPHAAPLQPLPLTLHVTPDAGLTCALNCCVPLRATVAMDGTTPIVMPTTLTLDFPDFVVSAAEVAVTVTVCWLGTDDGAVYSPLLLTLPHADPEQPEPETLHVTAVLLVPLTLAVNCCVKVTPTVLVPPGVTVTDIPLGCGPPPPPPLLLLPPPPHAVITSIAAINEVKRNFFINHP